MALEAELHSSGGQVDRWTAGQLDSWTDSHFYYPSNSGFQGPVVWSGTGTGAGERFRLALASTIDCHFIFRKFSHRLFMSRSLACLTLLYARSSVCTKSCSLFCSALFLLPTIVNFERGIYIIHNTYITRHPYRSLCTVHSPGLPGKHQPCDTRVLKPNSAPLSNTTSPLVTHSTPLRRTLAGIEVPFSNFLQSPPVPLPVPAAGSSRNRIHLTRSYLSPCKSRLVPYRFRRPCSRVVVGDLLY